MFAWDWFASVRVLGRSHAYRCWHSCSCFFQRMVGIGMGAASCCHPLDVIRVQMQVWERECVWETERCERVCVCLFLCVSMCMCSAWVAGTVPKRAHACVNIRGHVFLELINKRTAHLTLTRSCSRSFSFSISLSLSVFFLMSFQVDGGAGGTKQYNGFGDAAVKVSYFIWYLRMIDIRVYIIL